MTKEEFQSLSSEAQELFINNGGQISPAPITIQENKDGQVESSVSSTEPESLLNSSQTIDPQPDPSSFNAEQWSEGFDFKDPVELLFALDDDIASGRVVLHKWQVEFMLDFADSRHTKDHPFQSAVRACNGSGKDKYIVAACVTWLCMRFRAARGVVTNGSGVQLDNQTETYIRQLCENANKKFGGIVWKCNYRYYECLVTQSPITLFATDEPNKAEGYHPLVAGAKMAIFASEAKAIPDSIFTALERCTGFTHRVDVSTPGLPMGYFFDVCSTSLNRKTIKDIKELKPTDFIEYHVTAYDCSHISQNEIDKIERRLPGGKNSPVFKSAILAEFGTTDEMVVIPYTYIWQAFNSIPKNGHEDGWIKEPFNKGGLDLSDGGDETVLTVRNGNKHLITIPFKFDNTQDTINFLEEKFKEHDLTNKDAYIYADCGGLGKPMIDQLRRRGWSNIRYVDNRNTPHEPRTYLNRGTELWFHLRQLFEHREILLQKEDRLIRQLSTRYYKIDSRNRHCLLSKIESRSRGYPSPDRADSFTLAFWDYKSTYKEVPPHEYTPDKPYEQRVPAKIPSTFSLKSWATKDTQSLQGFRKQMQRKRKDSAYMYEQILNYNRQLKEQE